MNNVTQGVIAGLVFGAVAVAIMVPMSMPQKRDAMIAAFLNRFGIGFTIAVASLPAAGWLKGLVFGLLLSLPAAIATRAYAPILGLGVVGSVIIGWIVG